MERIEKFMYDREIVVQAKDGSLVPWQRGAMAGLSDLEVLDTYNSQTRGICNYYGLASNFSKLTYFVYLMEYSCLKTLAKSTKPEYPLLRKCTSLDIRGEFPMKLKTVKTNDDSKIL